MKRRKQEPSISLVITTDGQVNVRAYGAARSIPAGTVAALLAGVAANMCRELKPTDDQIEKANRVLDGIER